MEYINDAKDITLPECSTEHFDLNGIACAADRAVLTKTTVGEKFVFRALITNMVLYHKTGRFPLDRHYRVISAACAQKYLSYLSNGDNSAYEKAFREYRKPQ